MTTVAPRLLRSPVPRPDAEQRLVCFPHAGGAPSFFRGWAEQLPDMEVHAVCYPGRAERLDEPPATDLRALAETIAVALEPLTDRPLVLFGHSLGAPIALETARTLEARGFRVGHLFASGSRDAECPEPDPGSAVQENDEETVRRLLELGGTDPELAADPEFQELVLPYVRADSQLFHDYVHRDEPVLHCPITTIVGDRDTDADLRPWHRLTTGPVVEQRVQGDHFYLRQQPPFGLLRRAANTRGDAWR